MMSLPKAKRTLVISGRHETAVWKAEKRLAAKPTQRQPYSGVGPHMPFWFRSFVLFSIGLTPYCPPAYVAFASHCLKEDALLLASRLGFFRFRDCLSHRH